MKKKFYLLSLASFFALGAFCQAEKGSADSVLPASKIVRDNEAEKFLGKDLKVKQLGLPPEILTKDSAIQSSSNSSHHHKTKRKKQ